MPNPTGKNGYGDKSCPSDEKLKEALSGYAALNLPQEVRIANLKSDLNYSIRRVQFRYRLKLSANNESRLTKLKQLNTKFQIPRIRKPPPIEVARQAVIDEVQLDMSQANGPNYFKTVLQQKGTMIPRFALTSEDTVRKIMVEHFPLGFDHRFPGKKRSTIPRTALNSNGPYHEISSDGHEKLGKQALEMGDIALPIYGYKDKWSDTLPFMQFVPNSRTSAAIGYLFLDFIETGAIPIQMTMDKGSEIGWQYAIQDALRHAFARDIDPEIYPVCRLIKSVHNTVIEGFWRWLKEKMGLNLKATILIGKEERIFSPNVEFHLPLFYWIFIPLLQAQLDAFRIYWNHHRVRSQKDKNMPSGHVPADAFNHPQNFGGLDCRIPIPKAAVDEMRRILAEEVGPRENHLSWFSAEFAALAENIYTQIGKPTLSLDTAWDVFQKMSVPMGNAIEL
ncbi:hypothetical protein DFH08DRAFT_717654 [Mycena albidolilacea]|uniref:Integrase core domain-containing protein n=1 Tax=Mycena albidolilacea TaxID=1033008 RepID=A0AAD7ECG8_9AGAR|nr:hypothetical protein DFH08DRAFT_717654 [Mycena albidolilacea]